MINFVKVYCYMARLIFDKSISEREKNNLSYSEMKKQFLIELWWDENDINLSAIFYDCLFHYLEKNENKKYNCI